MHRIISVTFAVMLTSMQLGAVNPFIEPGFRRHAPPPELAGTVRKIDSLLGEFRVRNSLPEIAGASDAVFVRRAYLAAAGRIPTAAETKTFLASQDPAKRAKLIDSLLASPEHADQIGMRFADLLRIKSEFPVNLWPNAVQTFHRKLRSDILSNRPYSEMAHEMLTASGSNFRVPYANFFRTTGDRSPAGLARITALTFMGLRTEKLPQEKQQAFEAFFSRIRYKKSSEWKEEFVYTDPEKAVAKAWLPGCGSYTICAPEEDPRKVLADALVSKDNPYFARAFVNRAWSWFFGKGLIDPADDIFPERDFRDRLLALFRQDPDKERAVHPELLELLTGEFVRSDYDMRHLFRLIMNCRTFHASSIVPPEKRAVAEKYFLSFPVRRIEAEIVVDSLSVLTDRYAKYSSVIPEPFTYLPARTRAVQIADGSISSSMLDLFGRPSRDSGKISERNNRVTAGQRLYLLNSNVLYGQLSNLGWKAGRHCKWDFQRKGIADLYLRILSRYPTPLEKKWIGDYLKTLPKKRKSNVWPDLVWTLVNSKEFLYYH